MISINRVEVYEVQFAGESKFLTREEVSDLEIQCRKVLQKENTQSHAIIGAVCNVFQVRESDLFIRRRLEPIVWPRQVAMCLCYELIQDATLNYIGHLFCPSSPYDHGTVLHAIRKVRGVKDERRRLQQVNKARLLAIERIKCET